MRTPVKLSTICVVAFLLFTFLFGTAVSALNPYQILNAPLYDPNSVSLTDNNTNPCGGGGNASIDRLLQAIAKHESGGDPTAGNTAGGAYGKYQYIDSTWQSSVKAYYPEASKYTRASDAPESIQDAVTYYRFSALDAKYQGSVWKIAVVQYYPAALDNLAYWMDRVPAPEAGNTETIREFANQMVDWVNNGDGSDIALKYKDVSDFQTWLSKDGLTNVPALYAVRDNGPAPTGGTAQPSSCTCSQAIISTAMLYAWPSYHPAPYFATKPEYDKAVSAAQAAGVYVGGGAYPGIDCGGFVTLTMRNSQADKNYNQYAGPTTEQQRYMDDNPQLYQNLGTKNNTKGLQPGDIAINSDHTYIYTGNEGFPGYQAVSASFGGSSGSWRSPMASYVYFSNSAGPFTWYRLICPGGNQ